MLLSLLLRNLPSILMAMTRKPVSASISKTVKTVSYNIELPTFFVESVFVATCWILRKDERGIAYFQVPELEYRS